jgi:hypothetical protein
VSSAKDFFLEKSQALLSLFDLALLRKKHTTPLLVAGLQFYFVAPWLVFILPIVSF